MGSGQSDLFRLAPHNSFLCASLIIFIGKVRLHISAGKQGLFLVDSLFRRSAWVGGGA